MPADINLTKLSVDEILDLVHGAWMADAKCRGADRLLFYPPENSRGDAPTYYKQGKAICAACPVQEQCLRISLLNGEQHGLWGGLTPRERNKVDNYQRWQVCVKCSSGFYYFIGTSRRNVCGQCHKNHDRNQESRHYEQ